MTDSPDQRAEWDRMLELLTPIVEERDDTIVLLESSTDDDFMLAASTPARTKAGLDEARADKGADVAALESVADVARDLVEIVKRPERTPTGRLPRRTRNR